MDEINDQDDLAGMTPEEIVAVVSRERQRRTELEFQVIRLVGRSGELIARLRQAEQVALQSFPKKDPPYRRCRYCGQKAILPRSVSHAEDCPFEKSLPCIGFGGHVWRLATDRERDNIAGTGGTWDLQYVCQKEYCYQMSFKFYEEQESFESQNTIGEPYPPLKEPS